MKSNSTIKVPSQLGNRAVYSSIGAMQFSQHADRPTWLSSYPGNNEVKGRLGILGGINVGQLFFWLIIGLVTAYTFALIGGINRRDSVIVNGGGQPDVSRVSSPAELTNNAAQEDGVVAGASIEEGEQSDEQEDEPKEDEDSGVGEASEEDQRPIDVAPANEGVSDVTQIAPAVNNPPFAVPVVQPDSFPESNTPSEPTKKVTTDIDPETGVETTTTVVNDNGTITTTVETLTPEEEVTADNGLKVE